MTHGYAQNSPTETGQKIRLINLILLSLRIFKPVPEDLSLRILFVPEDFREFRIDAGKWGIDVLHRYY